ncbi:hypothetical protein DMENIID0001_125320 [Sergentomyia squamirostris]
MSTQLLLKKWARQREVQEQKIEKSLAAKEFFDKNRNLTSHFESWTTPQFYQQRSEQLERNRTSQRDEEQLEERRRRLQEQREKEEREWQLEMKRISQRPRKVKTEALSEINRHLGEEKRKSDLENQLYSRWRLDGTRDKIIHESRSTHEALAKLSWLDKQVEQSMEREKQKKEALERERMIQEETERKQQILLENRQVLDGQMRELRSIQESHMEVMQKQNSEYISVKQEEDFLRQRKQKIENLYQEWRDQQQNTSQHPPHPVHNHRRIKMIIEQRISHIHETIQRDLDFMMNLLDIVENDESMKPLIRKFQKHLEETANESDRVKCLYDSEAKFYLTSREVTWSAMTESRERLIQHSVTELLTRISLEIEKMVARFQELREIKSTHLRAIEHTSDLLRELTTKQSARSEVSSSIISAECGEEKLEDHKAIIIPQSSEECDSIVKQLSSQRITPREEQAPNGIPRFGKKKIAWT